GRATLAFDIEEGEIEGTDVGGLKFVAIIDAPKVMTEGNWKLGAYVDANASDEQMDKLVKVFTGQLGGPMEMLAPLVGEVLGIEKAEIEIDHNGGNHTVRAGDAIGFEAEDIVPFGGEDDHVGGPPGAADAEPPGP